jgi:hypothetical protein
MNSTTEKPSKSTTAAVPKQGEHFRCQRCGMELEITNGCKCMDPGGVHFQCCGQEMNKK